MHTRPGSPDAVERAELGEGDQPLPRIPHEPESFRHRTHLSPRHRAPSGCPGLAVYAMSPDYSVSDLPRRSHPPVRGIVRAVNEPATIGV